MKYTQKSQDFQRRMRLLRLWAAVSVFQAANTYAQEIVWPLPASSPEILLGAQSGVEGYDHFFSPIQSVTLFGGRRSAGGTFFGKVSGGRRSGQHGLQAEVEAYPILGGRSYGYAAYAWGSDLPFARHRGGLEYFTALPDAYEVSGGMRIFQFHDRRTVVLGTGALARYAGNFWFSGRPYVSVNLRRLAVAATVAGRYYFGEREEFWSARFGAGFTPDERSSLYAFGMPGSEVITLRSQSVGGGIQAFLVPHLLGTLDLTVTRQEVGFRRGTYVWDVALLCGIRLSR